MMILSNNDLYKKVRETVAALMEQGMETQAINVGTALKISSMPGEILGELRIALQKIDTSNLSKELTYDISSEITYIDSVLG